jgi:serine/threonine protein kinase
MPSRTEPARLGRFQIVKRLGGGAQGEVYLAQDTRLNRRVAIKTLNLTSKDPRETVRRVRALLDEAQMVSQLSHPGIVPLYDAGEDGGTPYLVFEYVEGAPLAARLREGPLPPAEAVDLAIQVLKAIGYAHAKGVLHRDIKPGNVLLSSGQARLMDFGIARFAAQRPAPGETFSGTPAYLAPEYIEHGVYTACSDVFSVGMVLYHALTGGPAMRGENAFETLHRQVHEPFEPPSRRAPGIDERLDGLVLKAIAKSPDQRFPDAASMEDALYVYLNPEPAPAGAPPADKHGTLQFLLRRMRHKSDFPALSSMIGAVNRAASSQTERISELSNSILKNFALTNKLLKLVNTACYGQFQGGISTVSRAVMILGYENVRQIAATLLLLDHLQNKAQAGRLRDEVLAAYLAGLLGRELVSQAGIRDAEEAFVCSLFHGLGRLLTAYYFDDEFQEIARLQGQGLDECNASTRVLGLSFEELGIGVARSWHFPERLLHSMRRIGEDPAKRPASGEERLRLVANLSAELCAALREPRADVRRARIAALGKRYHAAGIGEPVLASVAQSAVAELAPELEQLGVTPGSSALVATLLEARRGAEAHPEDPLTTVIEETTLTEAPGAVDRAGHASAVSGAQRQEILTAGIQDITGSLVGEFELNDILRMILETMYRGIGFSRAILCVRDAAGSCLAGRFGFGADVDRLIARGFGVPLTPARDAFYAAIASGSDIYIADVDAERIRDHIPQWYRQLVPARSLALFPVLLNKKPLALFYGDSDRAGGLSFAPAELNLVKTLRNQAVLAFRQKA